MKKNLFTVILFVIIVFTSCSLNVPNENMNDNESIFVPVFNSNNTSKAYKYTGINDNNQINLYGTIFLPQLSCFNKVDGDSIDSTELTVKILHKDVVGTYDYSSETKVSTYRYDVGENDGYIEIKVDLEGNFTYKQYIIMDINDGAGYMYLITEYDNCKIDMDSENIGSYTLKNGLLYYGNLEEKDSSTIISPIISETNIYVHGDDTMVFGFVDPVTVIDPSLIPEEDLLIASNVPADITIDDILNKLDTIKSFTYERDTNNLYPINDMYYDVKNDKFYGFFTEGVIEGSDGNDLDYDLKLPNDFEVATGISYSDLGFGDCENIYELLGKGTGVDYKLIGDNTAENWITNDKYTYCDFTVEETGVYLIFPGFVFLDSTKEFLFGEDKLLSDRGYIYTLDSGTQYSIGFEKDEYELDTMKNYSYLFTL